MDTCTIYCHDEMVRQNVFGQTNPESSDHFFSVLLAARLRYKLGINQNVVPDFEGPQSFLDPVQKVRSLRRFQHDPGWRHKVKPECTLLLIVVLSPTCF